MMVASHMARGTLALVLALSLAGCGDGAGGSEASGTNDSGSQVDGILAIDDGEEGLLGSVKLPKPDWMPNGMPLPKDAHIYLATHRRVSRRKAQAKNSIKKAQAKAQATRYRRQVSRKV